MYRIEVGSVPSSLLSGKLMSCLKETASYDCLSARLARLISILDIGVFEVTVYQGSCPMLRIEVFNGRETRRSFCGDSRTDAEKEADIRLAERSRLKNQRVGFVRGDLTSWILKEHFDVPESKKARVTHFAKQ